MDKGFIIPAIWRSSICSNNYHILTNQNREVTMLWTDQETQTTQYSLEVRLCSRVSTETLSTLFPKLQKMPMHQNPRFKQPRTELSLQSTNMVSKITSNNTCKIFPLKKSNQDKDLTRTWSSTAKLVFTRLKLQTISWENKLSIKLVENNMHKMICSPTTVAVKSAVSLDNHNTSIRTNRRRSEVPLLTINCKN